MGSEARFGCAVRVKKIIRRGAVGITAAAAFFCIGCGSGMDGPGGTDNIGNVVSDRDMIFVKGGTFAMGCIAARANECEDDEKPAHSVTLSDFYIGKHEVTQRQWYAVMGSNPTAFTKSRNLPIDNVTWNEVQEFISKLNGKTGKNYRLPTEAEWEYAARGGDKSGGYKYSGSDNIDKVAWYRENSDLETNSVGHKQPNELGIYDMSGNVWEWVNDCYGTYKSAPETDPQGPLSGSNRVYRGGSWDDGAEDCRISSRDYYYPSFRSYFLGFRLALSQ